MWSSRASKLEACLMLAICARSLYPAQFVIEAEDGPTVGWINEDCPSRGPVLGAAKNPADPEHSHVSRLHLFA
jgi:hypothetical protein